MKFCKLEKCDNQHYAKGYCAKHYAQTKRHGKPLTRTRFDSNGSTAYPLYTEISLYNNRGSEVGRAKIDNRDLRLIRGYKWRLNCSNYVVSGQRPAFYMHNLFINKRPFFKIIFKNGNKLDNRRENLEYRDMRHLYPDRMTRYINQEKEDLN